MAAMGLRLVRSQGMEGFSGNLNEFPIDPTNANSIFTGDPVILNAGFVEEATGGAGNNDFDIVGVFMGCRFVGVDGSYEFRNHWDGGAGREQIFAHVAMPPHSLFHIRGAGGGYTQADIGTRKGMVYNAGSTIYGDSRSSLGAAGASVATGPLLVHRLVDLPGNTFDLDDPVFEVSIVRDQGHPRVIA